VPSNDESAEIVVVPKKFVYAVFPSSQQLYGWSINATNGSLSAVTGSPFAIANLGFMVANSTGVNLTSMAVNPAGTLLFFAYAGSDQIDVYQIGSTGTLTEVPGAPFSTLGTIQPWNLSFDGQGKYLYVTSGMEGLGQKVAAYSIGTSGALTAVQGSPFAFNMWQLQGDPSGKYMIGISGRSNALNGLPDDTSLYVFSIQQSGANAGALTQVSGSPFSTQYAPVNLAVQPVSSNGNFVYSFSLNLLEPNSIEGYQLDSSSGALTVMANSPFSNIGTGPWGQFDQSGAYLFIFSSTSTSSSLGVLNVASGTGVLTEPLGPVTLDPSTYFAITDAP
jgi:6-phosphogluconolactonase (cycloisomerase 2 family)